MDPSEKVVSGDSEIRLEYDLKEEVAAINEMGDWSLDRERESSRIRTITFNPFSDGIRRKEHASIL